MAGPGGREIGRLSIRVLPDTDAFKTSLEKFVRRMERSFRLDIPTGLDMDGALRDAQRAVSAVEKSAEVDLPTDVDTAGATARVRALVRRLSGQAIELKVDVDKGLASARTGFARLGSVMSSLVLPTSIISATPLLLGLGAAAGQAAGALYVLPAAGLAGAAAFGALKLGVQGFGTALKDMDDPAAFAKALEKLAPAARESAIALRDLKPAFADMQLHVQQQLFDGLATTIREVGGTYLPMLKSGLGAVAQSMGDMAESAGKALMRPDSISAVNNVLAKTHEMFQAMVPALGNFLRGFLSIADVGAKFLPAMGKGVADVAQRFAEWASAPETTAKIYNSISHAITVLKQLGSIAGNVKDILTGLFSASSASGAGALAVIQNLTKGLADFINSAQGSTALGQIFSGIGAAMDGIIPAVTKVVQALVIGLGPVIEQLGPAVGQLATQLGTVLVQAIQFLAPLLTSLAGFLADNMSWLGPIGIAVGGVVAALSALGPVVSTVIGVATRLSGAFRLVTTAFSILRVAFMANPWGLLITAVIALVGIIIANWDTIKTYLLGAWEWLKSTATTVFGAISSFITGTWATITASTTAAWESVKASLSAVWQSIASTATGVWNSIVAFFTGAWQRIQSTATGVWSAITGFLTGTWNSIAGTARAVWSGLTGFFAATWNAVRGGVTAAWNGIRSTIVGGVNDAVNTVRTLPGRALAALGNLGGYLIGAGRDLVSGFINGVRGMIGSLMSTVRNMASSAVNAAKSMLGIASPSKVFRQLGEYTGEGFADGIQRGTPGAVGAASEMAAAVAATPVASPAYPGAQQGGQSDIQAAVTAGVFAALNEIRMRMDGDGLVKFVSAQMASNARR